MAQLKPDWTQRLGFIQFTKKNLFSPRNSAVGCKARVELNASIVHREVIGNSITEEDFENGEQEMEISLRCTDIHEVCGISNNTVEGNLVAHYVIFNKKSGISDVTHFGLQAKDAETFRNSDTSFLPARVGIRIRCERSM